MKDIILASTSPRRKEILEKTRLEFRIDSSLDPAKQVEILSSGKAKAVADKNPGIIVIGADTMVAFNHQKIGKPKDEQETIELLANLSGKPHSVVTGYTVIDSETQKTVTKLVETKVFFRNLSQEEILAYVKTGEPVDKAGGYGIQVIEGDFYNVMGLPLSDLVVTLKEFGIEVLK